MSVSNRLLGFSLLVFVVLLIVVFVGVGVFLYGISNGDRLAINNHYVNASFDGWFEYSLNGIGTIMIPCDMLISQEDNILRFSSSNNQTIALGAWLSLTSKDVLFESIVSFSILETSSVPASIGYFGNGAHLEKVCFSGNNNSEECYVLSLPAATPDLSTEFIIIFDPSYQGVHDIYAIAEAMAYSFERIG